jgi:outer membrane protein TolC
LGKSGYSDSFGGSLKDLDGESYDIRAGINLEYPLFNRSAKARHKRAVLSRDQSDVALKNMTQIVQLDVRSAYIEVKRTSEQVLATAATRKLQEEKMRAEIEKFRVGKSTSLLVAQTQRDLTASRISEIESIVGYLKSLIELYRLEGSLLERRGIELF